MILPHTRLKKFIIALVTIGLTSHCQLKNFAECGSFKPCEKRPVLEMFAILLFGSDGEENTGGSNLAGINSSGARDTADIYNAISQRISDDAWNESAVRKVLHAFAFGGGTTEAQIKLWADMTPGEAIVQMIGMWTQNPRLALAYEGDGAPVSPENASLSRLANYFGAGNYARTPSDFQTTIRWNNSPGHTWVNATRMRGLNPVRQRIALFETNYHMAVNLDKNVNPQQMVVYYDSIANDIAQGLPYHEVLGNAALSAAIATQYNHRRNVFQNGSFRGNEDFAREYHQLFFGILGTGVNGLCTVGQSTCSGNPESFDDHEFKTIRQTAEALTDIRVEGGGDFLPVFPEFGSANHYPGEISIYGRTYGGSNARERIRSVSPESIRHPESQAFLPLIIVRGLADENLDPNNLVEGCVTANGYTGISGCDATAVTNKIATIRAIWLSSTESSNGQINLIEFLRKYAISSAFHNPSRIKFLDSTERNLTLANQLTLNNTELGANLIPIWTKLTGESVTLFRPEHDVFGGQTGLEAANTDDVFINQYNSARNNRYGAIGFWSNNRTVSVKNFRSLLQRELGKNSDFGVRETAEFLWRRITGDQAMTHFTAPARIQVYALLANGNDFLFYKDTDCRNNIWNCTNTSLNSTATLPTAQDLDLANPTDNVRNLRDSVIFRNTATEADITRDNERVGYAIDFISATPFTFVQTNN